MVLRYPKLVDSLNIYCLQIKSDYFTFFFLPITLVANVKIIVYLIFLILINGVKKVKLIFWLIGPTFLAISLSISKDDINDSLTP